MVSTGEGGPAPARLSATARLALGGCAALIASLALVAPTLLAGGGFYLDDWRNLVRVETVGWLRSAELSRLASRPGAWAVETVLYPVLGAHPVAWLVVLAVLSAVAAVVAHLLLRRFVPERISLAVVAVWLVLPNHLSLRVFANTAPMLVGAILLCLAGIAVDEDRVVLGALLVAAGSLCYEAMLIPGLAGIVVLHRSRARGTPREVRIALAVVVGAGLAMLIHPTYPLGRGLQGTPRWVLPAHIGAGVAAWPAAATALTVVAVVGTAAGLVGWMRGHRTAGSGPWLVVVGLTVVVLGLAAFVLKWPTWYRGQADRNFVVSSFGMAMVWVGIARLAAARSRVIGVGLLLALVGVFAATTVAFQRDWVRAADETRRVYAALDCRTREQPGRVLVVGPEVPVPGGVRPIHDFYAHDAALVLRGRDLPIRFALTPEAWEATPSDRRVRWDDLLADHPCRG